MCQDTGTAIISAVKGERVISGGSDAESLSKGIFNTYRSSNLRYSQLAPITMFEEKNTGNNLPAQIDIYSGSGNEYKFTFIQKKEVALRINHSYISKQKLFSIQIVYENF